MLGGRFTTGEIVTRRGERRTAGVKPMTEEEWLTATDPQAIVRYLFPRRNEKFGLAKQFRPSSRKLRLFACACHRHASTPENPPPAVVTACEVWADGGKPVKDNKSWTVA